jgi:DNA-directed RNA polymerase beta' subunit
MSGREGVCDTATGTAKSGYIQRKIVKLSEDLQVQYDGSVRDTTGKIYQWCYNKGIDPLKQVKVNGELNFCNINRLSEKLNSKFEYNLENIKNN